MPYPYAPIPKDKQQAGAAATPLAAPPITPAAPPAPFGGYTDAPGNIGGWEQASAPLAAAGEKAVDYGRINSGVSMGTVGMDGKAAALGSNPGFASGTSGETVMTNAAEVGQKLRDEADAKDPAKQMEKAYQDLIKSYDSGLQNRLGNINAQTSADRRRAANVAGMSGRSLGGGFAGAQRQASIGGMRLADDAIAGNETQKREAMMSMLKQKLDTQKGLDDKDFEREMSANSQQNAIELLRLQVGMNPQLSPK